MTDVNFNELLDIDIDAIPDVVPLPEGTYNGRIVGYEFGKSKNKGSPYVMFRVQLEGPAAGVDQAEYELATKHINIDSYPFFIEMYLHTPKVMERFKKFMKSCGKSGNLNQVVAGMVGEPVLAEVQKQLSEKGEYYNPQKLDSISGKAQ